jgi:putative ABC transport system substrate-binding protein
MHRRAFLAAIGLGAYAATRTVRSQPTEGVRRLGFLREGAPSTPNPLLEALRALGWIENRNYTLERRFALNREELAPFAADLVRLKVDLIITTGTPATIAARQETTAIPIVFSIGGDPVARGLVSSMARPGGNLTGYTLGLYDAKQLQILRAAIPGLSRVAYAILPVADPHPDGLEAMKTIGVEIQGIPLRTLDDFAWFFTTARQAGAEAALIHDVALLNTRLGRIGMEAAKSRMPAMGYRREFVESGGLMSYAPTESEVPVRMAIQIDRILRGAKPATLPVEQPTRFELVINLREAKRLGLSIPPLVRLAADELIQ